MKFSSHADLLRADQKRAKMTARWARLAGIPIGFAILQVPQ